MSEHYTCIDISYCPQKVLHLRMSPSNVGISNFGSLDSPMGGVSMMLETDNPSDLSNFLTWQE